MKYIAIGAMLGLMLTPSGCKPTPNPAKLLKAMAENLSTYNTTQADLENNKEKNRDNFCGFSHVAYDVEKTDSLVSPYVGVITGWLGCTSEKTEVDTKFKVMLVFQDERWVVKDITGAQADAMGELNEPMTSASEGLIRQVLKSD